MGAYDVYQDNYALAMRIKSGNPGCEGDGHKDRLSSLHRCLPGHAGGATEVDVSAGRPPALVLRTTAVQELEENPMSTSPLTTLKRYRTRFTATMAAVAVLSGGAVALTAGTASAEPDCVGMRAYQLEAAKNAS